jgi:hypothetical protein
VPTPAVPPSDDPFSGNTTTRRWTDNTGRFSLVARYVAQLPGGVVRLQKSDGGFVRVPLERLSSSDQQFVRERDRRIALK